MKAKITQQHLKDCLTYDPETGIFVWKIRPRNHFKNEQSYSSWNTKYSNKICNTKSNDYLVVIIDRVSYLLHRLAFLYMEGYFPEYDVDHINGKKDDNRWVNLRHASRSCNMQNCKIMNRNISGVTGVHWSKTNKKWCAQISINKKAIHLGSFKSFDGAVKARYNEELNNPNWECSSNSSAYIYLKERGLIE